MDVGLDVIGAVRRWSGGGCLLAESHLTRRLFAGMLAKIAMLPSPAG
jgi:hypothetical protein